MDMKLSHCMRIAAYGMRPNNQERKWGGGAPVFLTIMGQFSYKYKVKIVCQ